jgi:tetratricopeptide (TPR) repeat protein
MIRRRPGSFAVLLFLLGSSAALVVAESIAASSLASRAEIQVRVTLDNHHTVGEQLRVDLLNRNSVPTHLTFTDSSGRAWIQVDQPGEYRVRVSGRSIQAATSAEITVDDLHPAPIAAVQVKPRTVVLFDRKGKHAALTSATDLGVPPDAHKYFHDGLQALSNNNYNKARSLFEKAIAVYPRYDAAYNNLGVIYVQLNEPTKAWLAFDHAVQINDKNADADRNFARLLVQTGAFKRAESLLRKSLVVDPLNPAALMLIAGAEIATGDWDGALRDARKVHELPHEGYAEAHYIAGRAFEQKHQLRDATEEYELFLKESPDGPEVEAVRRALSRVTEAETASAR